MICEYCGDSIRSLGKKLVEHINISQPQQTHLYCSQSCKDKWCIQLLRKKTRLLVIWSVGSYVGRYFFVKKLMKVRSPSLLGSESNKSYFKSQFQEIEVLELVELNGKNVLKVKTWSLAVRLSIFAVRYVRETINDSLRNRGTRH